MKRLAWILVATVGLGVVLASAASLGGIASAKLGADDAAVPSCDPGGFNVSYTTSGDNVSSVDVTGIADPACEGGTLSLQLTNAGTSVGSGGPLTVPTDGDTADNSLTVAVSPTPDALTPDKVSITIAGP